MDTATETNGTTTKAAKFKPIRLACPHCGENGGNGATPLQFDLGSGLVRCPQCDETVTQSDLDAMIEEAYRLIRFMEMARTI